MGSICEPQPPCSDPAILWPSGSKGRAGKPSAFEQSLNINSWGQLPQIVVDRGDGFTIGNPARFGRGSYPDEDALHYAAAGEMGSWQSVIQFRSRLRHETDATSRLRNQTGTYHYASVGDFASDALAFFAFGLNGQLNPMDQHNCDQRGKPWRDAAGVLHGLGYLPCYSYYSQMMGPSEWWLSTNDWAGYATSQWQPWQPDGIHSGDALGPGAIAVIDSKAGQSRSAPDAASARPGQSVGPARRASVGIEREPLACDATGLWDVLQPHAECGS